jgi:site-specific DNA recombinase
MSLRPTVAPPPIRAVIYARYSSDNQRDASLDDQIRLCKEWIVAEGWQLVQVFRDAALSGASAFRPAYQALMEGAREAVFDVVVAEALDRLSRDQEDIAGLFKRLRFAAIRIVTLAEGEVSELHVGLKGTMNALFLKDLAAKTRRGLRGRVEAGKSGGGNAYGYRMLRAVGPDSAPVTGERIVDLAEAAVVTRIFRAYAAGESPKRIALRLNADGMSGPRGGAWSGSTINGNRQRGTGILNNELYVGRLVWNRLGYSKDPDTGRRRSRPKPTSQVVTVAVPDLRIIDDELWQAVRDRQERLDRQGAAAPVNFWSKQRPRYLFSGLMRCAACGGGYSKISQQHFGCSTARNKGPTSCDNRLTIRRDVLEQAVLEGLRDRMMDPALFKAFVAEFIAEWNRLQAGAAADTTARAGELERVRRQIERLVDALADGAAMASVRDRLTGLEARRLQLERDIADSVAPAPRLHPNLAEVYRQRVAILVDTIASDNAAEVRERVRGLVSAILLIPEDGKLRIEIRGELAAILALSAAATRTSADRSADAMCEQVKMVAGIGFEPMTFRL